MPIYGSSERLNNDEWILLQVKEGPCNAGCEYCYENEPIKEAITEKQRKGLVPGVAVAAMGTLELSHFVEAHREALNAEMPIEEIRNILSMVKRSGISRVGLIGSEPTSHSQFPAILDLASDLGISLLVYTSGLAPDRLQHPAINIIVLHLDYGRLGGVRMLQRSNDGTLPPDNYMGKIIRLLESGKEVHLRVNFTSADLPEAKMVMNFFDGIPQQLKVLTTLKYSFTTRVAGDPSIAYFSPGTLRATAHNLLTFVDDFSYRHPEVHMLSERPLFPCSFEENIWQEYARKGGFVSSCDMEFTFYAGTGLGLCPPCRTLVPPQQVSTPAEFNARLRQLREFLRTSYLKPSFPVCNECEYRINLSCQGGCLGYKVISSKLINIGTQPLAERKHAETPELQYAR